MRVPFVMIVVLAGCTPTPRAHVTGPMPSAAEAGSAVDVAPLDAGPSERPKVLPAKSNPRTIVDRILFPKDSTKPLPEAASILDVTAAWMQYRYDIELIQIEGSAAVSEQNPLQLSTDRADAVVAELVNRGIDKKRLRAIGLGAYCPAGAGVALDQRADLKLLRLAGEQQPVEHGCAAARAAGIAVDP